MSQWFLVAQNWLKHRVRQWNLMKSKCNLCVCCESCVCVCVKCSCVDNPHQKLLQMHSISIIPPTSTNTVFQEINSIPTLHIFLLTRNFTCDISMSSCCRHLTVHLSSNYHRNAWFTRMLHSPMCEQFHRMQLSITLHLLPIPHKCHPDTKTTIQTDKSSWFLWVQFMSTQINYPSVYDSRLRSKPFCMYYAT